MCENCKRIGPWSTLERFIQPRKTKKASEELARLRTAIEILPDFNAEWDELKASSELIEKMPNNEYLNVIKKLNLQVRKSTVFPFTIPLKNYNIIFFIAGSTRNYVSNECIVSRLIKYSVFSVVNIS